MLVFGLMSGTSMDGITAAAVEVGGEADNFSFDLLDWKTTSYSPCLKEELLEVTDNGSVGTICRLNIEVGKAFAKAAQDLQERLGTTPDLIGSHGQTVCHLPSGQERGSTYTLQIGDGDVIADSTSVETVSDFRMRDVAAGGEGAPLIPYVDWKLFRSEANNRCTLNLGGIANVTYLPAGGILSDITAFDTGPANMVMDYLMRELTDGRLQYDPDGNWAARGQVDEDLLNWLLSHDFIHKPPPKSTGRVDFGPRYAVKFKKRAERKGLSAQSMVATVNEFSARSVYENCSRWLGPIDELIVSGGGAENETLMSSLRKHFSCEINESTKYGVPAEPKEALGFAILAYETYRRKPANVPQATGARTRTVLGKISPTVEVNLDE
ncbi:MAG: anhydro-N-acetylmuramic acid kinase [Candidatus Acetothermia bacterium]